MYYYTNIIKQNTSFNAIYIVQYYVVCKTVAKVY